MKESNLRVEDDGRFVDDARVFMYAVRPGWRWEGDGLWFKREWEEEDNMLSPTERTKRVVQASMQGLTKCLSFTVETCEDFPNGWLPTLDFQIRITESNVIEYSFFEKPTSPNRCLQADTALNQNSLMRSLSNEVGRRLDSFSETVALRERVAALDKFSQKLLNSGHSVGTVRKILVNGITGYQRKVSRCKAAGTPIHRSSNQSAASRRTKKLLAKTNWFRGSKEDAETGEESSQPWERQLGLGKPSSQRRCQAERWSAYNYRQAESKLKAGAKNIHCTICGIFQRRITTEKYAGSPRQTNPNARI